MLRLCIYAILILLFYSVRSVSSDTMIKCEPELKVIWSYNLSEKSSEFQEIKDNLTGIALRFDFGFIKLSKPGSNDFLLFRQSSIKRKTDNRKDLKLRYEDTSSPAVSKSSLIISDPMCFKANSARASIIDNSEFSFSNSLYVCECLSPVFDRKNFIYSQID